MLRLLMGFLGYVKVPYEVVRLSFEQEVFLTKVRQAQHEQKAVELFDLHIGMQKTLTEFLRTGRKI